MRIEIKQCKFTQCSATSIVKDVSRKSVFYPVVLGTWRLLRVPNKVVFIQHVSDSIGHWAINRTYAYLCQPKSRCGSLETAISTFGRHAKLSLVESALKCCIPLLTLSYWETESSLSGSYKVVHKSTMETKGWAIALERSKPRSFLPSVSQLAATDQRKVWEPLCHITVKFLHNYYYLLITTCLHFHLKRFTCSTSAPLM